MKKTKTPHDPKRDNAQYMEQELWFSTNELLEYLGISHEELDQQKDLFQKGIHFKHARPKDTNSQLLWRIDLIDELLSLPVPPLEREAMLNAVNNRITCLK
ncbi:hypothetical protein [Prochlorococcus sp. MIT 1300]|uniref:hypothetical protein n=1 Tax=Prochlorococcus sp. MIT 1300 TaxID=3096218 RepID=UPI002A7540DA|nr:hypothetical protein [Prochlorococcus sp. MIT 1300]